MPGYRKRRSTSRKPRKSRARKSRARKSRAKVVSRKKIKNPSGNVQVANLAKAGGQRDRVLMLLRSPSTKFYTILPGTNRPTAFPISKVRNISVNVWKNNMVVLTGIVANGSKATRIVGRK